MRALVLSGGGAKGAYQVGVLKHLLGERQERYDIISGTSVGALNGTYLAMYQHGDEARSIADLEKLWLSIDSSKIWRKWYWGALGMLPLVLPKWLGGKQSAFSTAPLRELVARHLHEENVATSGKKLRVNAVNLNTGDRRVWTESDTAQLKLAVLASSSFPMFFEPVEIDGHLFTDGGVREVSPIDDAIAAGATEVHLIGTGPSQVTGQFDTKANGLDLGQRILDAMSAEIEKWDVKVVDLYNALYEAKHPSAVGKRHVSVRVCRPKQNVLDNALDFSPAAIRTNVARGLEDAREMNWDAD